MHALAPGTIVGIDYEIVRPIKEGGMGAVYVARQRSTGRARALKILLPGIVASARGLERFEREARIGAEIPSAHVVEVLGAGVDAALGVPWIAMELVEGCELGAFADRSGVLAHGDAAEVARQMAHALRLAHAKGIVHRDLKPENILVGDSRTEGQRFTVKIVDFGIARFRDDASNAASASMGTPAWMAPEQADSGAAVDVRADVWSIGLVFFRVLTGKIFWRAAQPDVASFLRVMSEVCFEPIDVASRRAEELGGAPLPSGFDAWFARCVVRDPALRYASAEAALGELVWVLDSAAAERAVMAIGATAPVEPSRPSFLPLSARADAALPGVRQEQAFHLREFIGRASLLGRIDAWIDRDEPGAHAVLLLVGGPGSGKSALAAAIADRRGAVLHMVKSHKNPLRFLRALAMQADLVGGSVRSGPAPGDVDDARAELTASLERAVAVRRPLVVVIDGLDELDDPLDVGALPPHWPAGTRIVLTARPDGDLLRALRMRIAEIEELRVPPLDADDVAAIVRARRPDASVEAIREISSRTGGLPLLVRRALDAAPGDDVRTRLEDVFDDAYRSVARDAERARTLQLLVVAREALDAVSLAELAALSSPSIASARSSGRALLERVRRELSEMSEYLLEVRAGVFLPWHAGLADFVRAAILGDDGVRELEQIFARWTEPKDGRYTRYALRHRVRHLVAAGDSDVAARELAEPALVCASISAGRVFDLLPDLDRARSPFAAAVRRHAHFLGRHPSALPTVLASAPPSGPWLERVDVPADASSAEEFSFVGHADEVWGVAVSPDGARVATGSADGTLRLWDRETGRQVAQLELPLRPNGKRARVFAVAVAPDGSRLYIGAEGQGLASAELAGLGLTSWWPGETCWSIAVSRDGSRIAAGSRRGEVRVWSRDGALLFEAAIGGIITALAFDVDGAVAVGSEWKRLVVLGADGSVRFREPDLAGSPTALGFVGERLVAACADGVVRAWDAAGARVAERSFPGERLFAAAFDGDRIALAGTRGVVYAATVDAVLGAGDQEVASVRAHRAPIDSLAWLTGSTPETALVLTGAGDGTARAVRVATHDRARFDERVTALAYAPDGATLLSGMHDGALRIHRPGRRETSVALRRARIHALAFSADGALVALACQDGTAVVARLAALGPKVEPRAVVAELRAHEAAVNAIAFVPPSGRVVTGSSDETVALSTLFGGRVVRRWTHTASVVAVAADARGERVAAMSRAGDLAVWDVAGEAERRVARALPEGAARSVAFADDVIVVELRDGERCAFQIDGATIRRVELPASAAPLLAVSDRARAETRLERGGEVVAAYPFALEPCVVSSDERRAAGWYDGELHVLALR